MHTDARMAGRNDKSDLKNVRRARLITVSLPPENYDLLVHMAKTRKVSTSWMVRDAVDKYLSADVPLLKLSAP